MPKFILLIIAFLPPSLSAQNFTQSSWHITAQEIDPNNYYGVTVANGMIGMVSSPEPMKVKDVVLNGVYDYYQRGRVSNILKGFNHVNMDLFIDQHLITQREVSNYQQTLDMRQGMLTTRFDVGSKASVNHQIMALRHLPYTSLVIIEVTARESITITPASVIESPNHLTNPQSFYSEIDRPHVLLPLLTSTANSPSGNLKLAASSSFIFPEKHGHEPSIIHEDWDYNRHLAKFNRTLKKGETYRFGLVASTCSSAQFQDPHNEAERLTIFARLEGIERLLNRHQKQWEELWKSDIQVEGNLEDQKGIRFALYHLYSFARAGTAYSLSPMGLSGLGYNGHVFWDTELWMYPPLLMMQPDIARSLLEYRFERLDAAKQNAFSHGFKGAMFPWESADDGSEDTPVWALTGPFEHHITGCVGWAFWKYYQVSGDKEWLRTRGYPVLKEVADFWASRVERNGAGQYDINNVVGANEWEENIDNNAFTNAIAITVLRNATEAAQELGLTANPDWDHVADNIPILEFADGTTRENRTYAGQEIKQADVNLLSFPLNFITDKERMRKDLEYYEPRMSPLGPAMGFSVLSALHARLGNTGKAYTLFERSFKSNEVPPFGVISETAGGSNPYFATGAGGMLQAVLSGFGGLTVKDRGITQVDPILPKSWKSLKITGVGREMATFDVK